MNLCSLFFGVRPSLVAWCGCFLLGFSMTLGLHYLITGEPWRVVGAGPYLVLLGTVLWRCLFMAMAVKLLLVVLRDPPVANTVKASLAFAMVMVVFNTLSFQLPAANLKLVDWMLSWGPVAVLGGLNVVVNSQLYAYAELQSLLARQLLYRKRHAADLATPTWLQELQREIPLSIE